MYGHQKRQLSLLLKKKNGQKIVHLEVRTKKILIIMLGDEEGKAIANQSRLSPATEGNKGLYDLLNLKGETGPAGLCVRRSPSPSPRGACDEVQHLGKRPLSCGWGYACSSGTRSLGCAGGDTTRGDAAGNSLRVDSSGETETRGSEAGVESPPESLSEVDRTLFRNLVGAAAEETRKGI